MVFILFFGKQRIQAEKIFFQTDAHRGHPYYYNAFDAKCKKMYCFSPSKARKQILYAGQKMRGCCIALIGGAP